MQQDKVNNNIKKANSVNKSSAIDDDKVCIKSLSIRQSAYDEILRYAHALNMSFGDLVCYMFEKQKDKLQMEILEKLI